MFGREVFGVGDILGCVLVSVNLVVVLLHLSLLLASPLSPHLCPLLPSFA